MLSPINPSIAADGSCVRKPVHFLGGPVALENSDRFQNQQDTRGSVTLLQPRKSSGLCLGGLSERGPAVTKQSKQRRTQRMIRQLRSFGYRIEPPNPWCRINQISRHCRWAMAPMA